MKVSRSRVVELQMPGMYLLETVSSILRDKSKMRMACSQHYTRPVLGRLKGRPFAGIIELLLVGNQDLVANGLVNFFRLFRLMSWF